MGAETTDTTDTSEQATASNVRAPFAPWDRRDLPGSFDVTETALIQSLGYGRAEQGELRRIGRERALGRIVKVNNTAPAGTERSVLEHQLAHVRCRFVATDFE